MEKRKQGGGIEDWEWMIRRTATGDFFGMILLDGRGILWISAMTLMWIKPMDNSCGVNAQLYPQSVCGLRRT